MFTKIHAGLPKGNYLDIIDTFVKLRLITFP